MLITVLILARSLRLVKERDMKKLNFTLALLLYTIFSSAQFSIDQILSAPFPSGLTVTPDGNTLAWVFNDRGERNIVLATGAGFDQVRQLTQYSGDEGVGISSLTFSPDGQQLIYVRGNSNNKKGEAANPAQLQQSTDFEIFNIPLAGRSAPRSIAKGANPVFSPDGSRLLFLSKGQVWTIDPKAPNAKAIQLFQARGSQASLRWHPDGNKLAFVSRRGDHAFIGIYDFSTNEVTYPDPSADLDGEPVWSPDGKRLAYVRRPNVHPAVPFTPRRAGSPWSIRLLDVASGEAREIWKADVGQGSVFVGNLPVTANKLLWADGDQLIFPWEKSGWVHLYALDIKRELPKPLMWGDGEVENVVLSKDRKTLYYTANVGDLHRRHIWKLNIGSDRPMPILEGDGIEWSPVITANGIAMLRASASRPAWPAYFENGRVRDLAGGLFPKDFPRSLVEPETVTVKATDGMEVQAQLFLPANYREGQQYPAVIFLHGGSRRQMLNGFHYSSYYSNAYGLNQYFASQGYIVMALNYRSGIGYGLNFREADNYGVSGGSEVKDLFGAGEYLAARADVDPKRIGLWGGSYGGYLTAHGLAQRGDLFAAGSDIHGVHNWNTELPTFAPWYDSIHYAKIGQVAFQSSPMYYVDGWKNPVLFIHGDDDRNVPFSETVQLMEVLRKKGVYFEQLVFPDEVHGFLLHRNWVAAYKATFEFLDRYLGE